METKELAHKGLKPNHVLGIEVVTPKGLQPMAACFYTGKTLDQLKNAERNGWLTPSVGKDKAKTYLIRELDALMGWEEITQRAN